MAGSSEAARVLAMGAALLALGSTFIPRWDTDAGGLEQSAWSNFSNLDWMLALVCLVAVAVAVRALRRPWLAGFALCLLGALGVVLVTGMLVVLIQADGAGWAPMVALLGTLLTCAAGIVMATDDGRG